MPRYFCDYCDVYLTHDSAPGRKQHIRGWKHRENVKQYYEQYMKQFYEQNSGMGMTMPGMAMGSLGALTAGRPPMGLLGMQRPGVAPPLALMGAPGSIPRPPLGYPPRPPMGVPPPLGSIPPPRPPGFPPGMAMAGMPPMPPGFPPPPGCVSRRPVCFFVLYTPSRGAPSTSAPKTQVDPPAARIRAEASVPDEWISGGPAAATAWATSAAAAVKFRSLNHILF
jgi:U1 small nuclear ribonucleoprotein C